MSFEIPSEEETESKLWIFGSRRCFFCPARMRGPRWTMLSSGRAGWGWWCLCRPGFYPLYVEFESGVSLDVTDLLETSGQSQSDA